MSTYTYTTSNSTAGNWTTISSTSSGWSWDTNLGGTLTINDSYISGTISLDGGTISLNNSEFVPDNKNKIHPRLYFSFVKSKLKKNERKFLEDQIAKLNEMLFEAKEINQQGLYEQLAERIFFAVQDWELLAIGIDTYLERKDVEKFRYHIVSNRPVSFTELEEFPRTIPKEIRAEIKKYQDKNVFDKYWILYYDSATPVKTNEKKIKERDPIVFGTLDSDPDRLYFIADWEDEHCDLTLDVFIAKYKRKHKKSPEAKLEEFKPETFKGIIKEVKDRKQRLNATKRDTWEKLLEEEQKTKTTKSKSSIVSRLADKWGVHQRRKK